MRKHITLLSLLLFIGNYAYSQLTNDDCATAITLSVAVGSCSFTTYTTDLSTSSRETPPPTCSIFHGNDVWFKVKVPRSRILKLEIAVDNGSPSINHEF